ncbi:probable aspartic proteinase GIP2 [Pistacia vera]|uniref:probable aspartic proteinase GIP2 n=1 Tax=Pistacia vera TaxID=55513 RepID=UPI00126397F2|nr:probable aspartic proteinase GIP2 [Pistacia vera]
MGTPLEYIEVVVDLGGPLQWFDCFSGYNSSTYHPIYCGSSTCDVANAFGCNICGGDRFGCINSTCGPYLSNPFDQNILAGGILSEDTTSLSLIDGLRYLNDVLMRRLLFDGYGDIFIGGGPYYMPPYTKDLSKGLIKTKLLINPVTALPLISDLPSVEYFIDVKSIKIDGKFVSFNTSLLSIDKEGMGGTKLSTVTPYTILHAAIYKAL